ncbi:MAG: hypothetical protein IPI01_00345 [Ignavibacteriae bacterium]|nr:hypothetical protein [Ignavibacteriota bacterium]
MNRTAIENYLDPSKIAAITGVLCAVPQYGRPTDPAGNALTKNDLKTIKRNAGRVAAAMGPDIVPFSLDSSGASEWITLFSNVKNAFGL